MTLAPPKIVQYRKNKVSYFSSDLIESISQNNQLLTQAINTRDPSIWREF